MYWIHRIGTALRFWLGCVARFAIARIFGWPAAECFAASLHVLQIARQKSPPRSN